MRLLHSFDLKGFRFAWKILLACVVVGVAGHFALLYAAVASPISIPPPALVVVPQVLPTPAATSTQDFSTTTPERIIGTLTAADAVPSTGKFIVADLENMQLTLYQDGAALAEYPILTKGKPGSPYATPEGFYTVLTKEPDHFNKGEQIHMPYSMQFYGNYFIHGWPYYANGAPVDPTYSGGCIRLSTSNAEKVFAFAEKGTGVFVYDPAHAPLAPLVLDPTQTPLVSAASYLVADIDTGDVYLEQNAKEQRPIASLTKLMTALVANETIMFNKSITVTRGELSHATTTNPARPETFAVDDLLYPLLMESDNAIANRLAQYYGTAGFVDWMNTTAKALDMQSTHYTDASGVSAGDVSTADDLHRLAVYLADNKSFVWDISRTPTKRLIADNGDVYWFNNFNIFSGSADFIGEKVGKTGAAGDTMMSVLSIPVNGVSRRVAIIILKSDNYGFDTSALADWFTQSAERVAALASAACATCTQPPQYRKIQL